MIRILILKQYESRQRQIIEAIIRIMEICAGVDTLCRYFSVTLTRGRPLIH